MPLDDAVVLNDKIYGTMGPYVLEFNGTTGGLLRSQRVASPMLGDCRITSLGGILYVSTWNNPAVPDRALTGLRTGQAGIYPVNATTLAVGTLIDLYTIYALSGFDPLTAGVRCLQGFGTYLYCVIFTDTGSECIRINPLNTADRSTLTAIPDSARSAPQNFAIDAVGGKIYLPYQDDIEWSNLDGTGDDTQDTGTKNNYACAWSITNSMIYAVTGDTTLAKLNPATYAVSTFNLATIQANVKPFRIKYNAADARLYIPCQSQNGIIRWNPATDTGTWLGTGFESPIDVVFTSTKIWAVQNGITPLAVIPPV